MPDRINWSAPPLSHEDRRLIDAYVQAGRSVDDLPYTRDFERIVASLVAEPTDEDRYRIFKRLLALRKMARLPRMGTSTVPIPDPLGWPQPPLDPEDQRLIDAYVQVRRPLDDLPYTEDFDRVVAGITAEPTDDIRNRAFKRLVTLRKMGRLPRLGMTTELRYL